MDSRHTKGRKRNTTTVLPSINPTAGNPFSFFPTEGALEFNKGTKGNPIVEFYDINCVFPISILLCFLSDNVRLKCQSQEKGESTKTDGQEHCGLASFAMSYTNNCQPHDGSTQTHTYAKNRATHFPNIQKRWRSNTCLVAARLVDLVIAMSIIAHILMVCLRKGPGVTAKKKRGVVRAED